MQMSPSNAHTRTTLAARTGRPVDPHKDEAILEAVLALLIENGPEAVTMEGVAKAAGVSKVTVYRRYADRHALLRGVASKVSFALERPLSQPPNDMGALRRCLIDFADALSDFVQSERHVQLVWVVSSLPPHAPERLALYKSGPGQTHQRLAAYLRAAAARGLLNCADPDESAEQLFGLIIGLDWLRSLFQVPRQPIPVEMKRRHHAEVVDGFLTLYGADPGR
jgi:TetR/AcrR family transcriptional repressor of mexJK operon